MNPCHINDTQCIQSFSPCCRRFPVRICMYRTDKQSYKCAVCIDVVDDVLSSDGTKSIT